jgi:hypothetical protein
MAGQRDWARAGISEGAYAALANDLPPTELWSLLLHVAEQRALKRSPANLREQWEKDRFVCPAYIDQRTLNELDRHLLEAAGAFEALELSPLAPLGACSAVAVTSQHRTVSTVRGTEVVSDPTNLLALESARRLREDPSLTIRLATSHRCVRAQPFPKQPGFAAHFRLFCLSSAGHERKDHGLLVDALCEHIRTHLRALDLLERHGYSFPDRSVRILFGEGRQALGERVAAGIEAPSSLETFNHGYYDGLRFMIGAGSQSGAHIPLIDGGAFDWLRKLTSNNKIVFVASGLGSQLAAYLYRRQKQQS